MELESRYATLAGELNCSPGQVRAVGLLLAEGATVPFIARYRKEATGSLDEVAVAAIRDRLAQLEELAHRRESILKSLAERNLLTDALRDKVLAAGTLSVLEDIYLPFRPKRRTRGTVAREKGLEPLAARLLTQEPMDLGQEVAPFIDVGKGVADGEEALAGARHIIAEWIQEDQEARTRIRALFVEKGEIRSRVVAEKKADGSKYRDYFDWQEPIARIPSHRLLAMRRGEREGILSLQIAPPEEEALAILEALFVKGDTEAGRQVGLAVRDSYKRLLSGTMETETRLTSKKRADETAIRVFADNFRQLLLAPPLGQKAVMAIDPGFRTGCKAVCLDRQGKLLHAETLFPLLSAKAAREAGDRVRLLCGQYDVEAIAVGNGTGGRETEAFLRALALPQTIRIIVVNESGASVYSASAAAREEFPDRDVTVRGAVSIGRRLTDPLAELVKIDPKSIGVGQYQHDVDQGALKTCLDDVVISCVNAVGVEVNTASAQLLAYVSGLGPALASNIVERRNEKGPFLCRDDLRGVPRLGPKAFEQAAGFLRIRDGLQPLDASAVHPESYPLVERMAGDLGCTVADLMTHADLRTRIRLDAYVSERVGLPTLRDILAELAKPGRDPRREFEAVVFTEGIDKMDDLRPGMRLTGVVTNITAFGAFVDVGVHQDGLVHLSELSNRYVADAGAVVKVGQKVDVTVLDVDMERQRIALSMKCQGAQRPPGPEKTKGNTGKTGVREGGKDSREPLGKQPFNNPFADALKRR